MHSVETLSLKPVSESRLCEAIEAELAGRPCALGALAWCWGAEGLSDNDRESDEGLGGERPGCSGLGQPPCRGLRAVLPGLTPSGTPDLQGSWLLAWGRRG